MMEGDEEEEESGETPGLALTALCGLLIKRSAPR